jgi:hypothetical protein
MGQERDANEAAYIKVLNLLVVQYGPSHGKGYFPPLHLHLLPPPQRERGAHCATLDVPLYRLVCFDA